MKIEPNPDLITVLCAVIGVLMAIIGFFAAKMANKLDAIVTSMVSIEGILKVHKVHIDNTIEDTEEIKERLTRIEQKRR